MIEKNQANKAFEKFYLEFQKSRNSMLNIFLEKMKNYIVEDICIGANFKNVEKFLDFKTTLTIYLHYENEKKPNFFENCFIDRVIITGYFENTLKLIAEEIMTLEYILKNGFVVEMVEFVTEKHKTIHYYDKNNS